MSKKIYIPAEYSTIFEFLKNNIVFDFVNGPYIIGSSVVTNVEKLFHQTEHTPEDIDIVCRTFDQKENIIQKLRENYSVFTRPQFPVCIGVDFAISNHSAFDYLRSFPPYTVGAVAECKEFLLFLSDVLKDIKNKKLVTRIGNNCVLKKLKKRGYSE